MRPPRKHEDETKVFAIQASDSDLALEGSVIPGATMNPSPKQGGQYNEKNSNHSKGGSQQVWDGGVHSKTCNRGDEVANASPLAKAA